MSDVRRTGSVDPGRRTVAPDARRGRHATVPEDRPENQPEDGPDELAGAVDDDVPGPVGPVSPTTTVPTWSPASPVPEDTIPYAPSRGPSRVTVSPPPALPLETATTGPTHRSATPDRPRRRWPARAAVGLLVVLTLALGAATVHLFRTATAWEDRADDYLADARGLGEELATERAELAGTQAELDAVRDQLATAHGRIVELADEKAQIGDDREVQRQLVDYQERVSDAAGQVAHALDQCVQGQQQLIGYLQQTVEGTAEYDPADLERFTADVDALCQAASEANMSLQRELSR